MLNQDYSEGDGKAASALENGGGGGDKGGGDESQEKGSFYLPSDMPGMDVAKPGDILTFKVVGKTDDGEVEVEKCGPENKGKGMKNDPEWASMGAPSGDAQEQM